MNNTEVMMTGMGCPPLNGLGIVDPEPWYGGSTAPSVPWYQKLSNVFTKAEGVVKTATPVAQQGKSLFDLFKSTKNNLLNPTNTTNTQSPMPNAQAGMSNAAKVAIGVTLAAGIALVAIKLNQGSSRRKALGEVTDVSHEVIEPSALNGPKRKSRKRKSKSRK